MTTPDELSERLGYTLVSEGANATARRAALLAGASDVGLRPTSLVGYASSGKLLIVGPYARAMAIAATLRETLTCTIMSPDDGAQAAAARWPDVNHIRTTVSAVSGYLGAFEVRALQANGEEIVVAPSLLTAHTPFDMVLDLSQPPLVTHAVAPPGYFAPGEDEHALTDALAQLPTLKGEFEKPKYFTYDPDICAHGRSGVAGCTRCLDACPTGAVTTLAERVEVNPYLCQGGGVCASACPTGAMAYTYPRTSDLLRRIRDILAAYGEAGGAHATLLFHDVQSGRAWLTEHAGSLPGHVLPVEVEEVGSIGLEAWLCAAAYGAARLLLLADEHLPDTVRASLAMQATTFDTITAALGLEPMLFVVDTVAPRALGDALAPGRGLPGAKFDAVDEKRTNFRLAIDHLHRHAVTPADVVTLPDGAPFGDITVDREACTLCMACVSVCPAKALADGGDEPKLRFTEWNCVQCGICERACPEQAITRAPRLLFDPAARQSARVLNEDAVFACTTCGKPFATASVIARMREKLSGHWMFAEPDALARLEMCDECRVKDMFKKEGGMPDVHRKS